MNPYSHLVVASQLAAFIQPRDPADYYWGAVAPDVRYLAGMQRSLTHLLPEDIADASSRYPQLRSFLQGYLVHCLTDEIHLKTLVFQQFPLSLLRRVFSQQRLAVLLEFYFFEHQAFSAPAPSGRYNTFLSELGIDESVSRRYYEAVSKYIACTSFESVVAGVLPVLGLEGDSRIEKYLAAARSFEQHHLLRKTMFGILRSSRLQEKILTEAVHMLENGSYHF